MSELSKFISDRNKRINSYKKKSKFNKISKDWIIESQKNKYVYNFEWLGRPIIQYPNDIQILQEIVWRTKPDLIIETGIAHGGSLLLSASLLSMLDLSEYYKKKDIKKLNSKRKVIGIDIDIRKHNLKEIKKSPFFKKIELIQGSSTSLEVEKKILKKIKNYNKILVLLDSMHSEAHVLKELNIYSKFVSKGSYCIVYDTFINFMPQNFYSNRPWDKTNNPTTAIKKFLKKNKSFIIEKNISSKLMITSCINGFLKKK